MLKVDSTPRTAWTIASMAAALVVLVPVAVILSSVFRDSDGVWQHLEATRLGDYALNTLVLSLGRILRVQLGLFVGGHGGWSMEAHGFFSEGLPRMRTESTLGFRHVRCDVD